MSFVVPQQDTLCVQCLRKLGRLLEHFVDQRQRGLGFAFGPKHVCQGRTRDRVLRHRLPASIARLAAGVSPCVACRSQTDLKFSHRGGAVKLLPA